MGACGGSVHGGSNALMSEGGAKWVYSCLGVCVHYICLESIMYIFNTLIFRLHMPGATATVQFKWPLLHNKYPTVHPVHSILDFLESLEPKYFLP